MMTHRHGTLRQRKRMGTGEFRRQLIRLVTQVREDVPAAIVDQINEQVLDAIRALDMQPAGALHGRGVDLMLCSAPGRGGDDASREAIRQAIEALTGIGSVELGPWRDAHLDRFGVRVRGGRGRMWPGMTDHVLAHAEHHHDLPDTVLVMPDFR